MVEMDMKILCRVQIGNPLWSLVQRGQSFSGVAKRAVAVIMPAVFLSDGDEGVGCRAPKEFGAIEFVTGSKLPVRLFQKLPRDASVLILRKGGQYARPSPGSCQLPIW